MINKNTLQSVIAKYNLGGLINKVKWRVKDNTVTIYANASGLACKVYLDEFQLEDCQLAVFDTDKLKKLISITNGELMLSVQKNRDLLEKLFIADQNFDLLTILSFVFLIGKNDWYNHPEEGYEMEETLSNEEIDHLIKAKNALGDVNTMKITATTDFDGNPVCEFMFGDNSDFANKIVFNAACVLNKELEGSVTYNSDVFKKILDANKDMVSCKMNISSVGWSHFTFENEGLVSEYFLCRNEEI